MSFPVRHWILLAALLTAAGWVLSAFHQLNPAAYEWLIVAGVMTGFLFHKQLDLSFTWPGGTIIHKWRRRFRRPAPFIFLLLAAGTLVAGLLYPLGSSDTNAYRIPRTLHWFAAGGWCWIHTVDPRLNGVGNGLEWLLAPVLIFAHTNRFVFLLNWFSFLMLPGLTFSVLRRLGVARGVAWWWMWILSAGWCFVLQAESDMNDSCGTIFALAAVEFAFRARRSGRMTDLAYSLLAIGIVTGIKQSNILLGGLWVVVFWPNVRRFLASPLAACLLLIGGLLVSAVPLTFLNFEITGNWMGIKGSEASMVNPGKIESPLWGIAGNSFCIPVQNLMPPVLPGVEKWNAAMSRFVATPLGSHFRGFERFGYLGNGSHSVDACTAGIGLGVCLLLVLSLGWAILAGRRQPPPRRVPVDLTVRLARLAPWVLLLGFMAKDGAFANARHLAPYYIFFFPSLLAAPAQARLVHQLWWQWCALSSMLLSLLVLVMSREQPLFPAHTLFHYLETTHPHSAAINRLAFAYNSHNQLVHRKEWAQSHMIAGEKVLGYSTIFGDLETVLWLPFGQRQVVRILPGDSPEQLRAQGIHHVFVENLGPDNPIETWLLRYHAVLIDRMAIATNLNEPTSYIYFVSLDPPLTTDGAVPAQP